MVASMVSFWHGRPDRAGYRRFRMKTVTEQNDFACMAETVRRRYSRLAREVVNGSVDREGVGSESGGVASIDELRHAVRDIGKTLKGRAVGPMTDAAASSGVDPEEDEAVAADVDGGAGLEPSEELKAPWVPAAPAKPRFPDLILIDGGRGQLNAACAELVRLGLGTIPVLGLAKEYEEIHLPDRSEPLRLGLDSAAVKLLQRVRDEAHRFANTYNAQLRLKRISESLLDEFPGIGEARKQALLKRFGSVQRLRMATAEQIGEVSGFGERLAGELKAFLEARRG
jgi:excinuclease ABC subunit C